MFLDMDDVFAMLQVLSIRSRTYGIKQSNVLKSRLFHLNFTPRLYSKGSVATVLSMYGRSDDVLQMMQMVSTQSRR